MNDSLGFFAILWHVLKTIGSGSQESHINFSPDRQFFSKSRKIWRRVIKVIKLKILVIKI